MIFTAAVSHVLSLCSSTQFQCGGVKASEYWISAHPLSVLLALGIVIPVKHHQAPRVGAAFRTAGSFRASCAAAQARQRQTWRRLFPVIPYVSLCWHESGQQLSSFQASRLLRRVASQHSPHAACGWMHESSWHWLPQTCTRRSALRKTYQR